MTHIILAAAMFASVGIGATYDAAATTPHPMVQGKWTNQAPAVVASTGNTCSDLGVVPGMRCDLKGVPGVPGVSYDAKCRGTDADCHYCQCSDGCKCAVYTDNACCQN